jgi:hypothetical protein
MSKIQSAVIILLCFATATAGWMIYDLERQRHDWELRDAGAREHAALEAEMYQAWHYATRYETFKVPLSNSEQQPKESKTFPARNVWIKAFQRKDVKPLGRSPKFGNATYEVNSIIGINDRVSKSFFEYLMSKNPPLGALRTAMNGEWHRISVRCRIEKMDGPGDWVAGEWKFAPTTYNEEFPAERVKAADF